MQSKNNPLITVVVPIYKVEAYPLLPEEAEMVLECSAGRRCYEWTASIRLVAM